MAEDFGVKRAQDTLRDQVHTVAEDLRELAKTGKQAAKQLARDARDRGREKVDAVRGDVQSYVEEHPVKALLIAAGTGMVIGALLARRR